MQNDIRNIAFIFCRDISNKDYGTVSTIDKNSESGYYPVKWTSKSYNFKSSHKLGKYVIKAGELVCDSLYLNPLANFNQCYTPYLKKSRGKKSHIEYYYFNQGQSEINK